MHKMTCFNAMGRVIYCGSIVLLRSLEPFLVAFLFSFFSPLSRHRNAPHLFFHRFRELHAPVGLAFPRVFLSEIFTHAHTLTFLFVEHSQGKADKARVSL